MVDNTFYCQNVLKAEFWKISFPKTLNRIRDLDVEIIHAGHEPSFGKAKMQKIIDDYFLGKNSMPADPITWFNEISNHNLDNYSNQNWTLNKNFLIK